MLWAPADPIRPLIHPGLAGCTTVATLADGSAEHTTYDDLGRPVGTSTHWYGFGCGLCAEARFTWQGDCLVAFDRTSYRAGGQPHSYAEEQRTCDTAGFPITFERWVDAFDKDGLLEATRAGWSATYDNTYRGGRLVQIDQTVDGRPSRTTLEWDGDQLVRRMAAALDAPDNALVETWTWRADRLVETTSAHTAPDAVRTRLELHWRGGRYAGFTRYEDEVAALEVTYRFAGTDLPVTTEEWGLGPAAPVVTTWWEFDCP